MYSGFTHLHVHTHYSLLDGACTVPSVVDQVAAHNMQALAITDHGSLYGAVEFYKACTKKGIKPILGCEVYVADGSRHVKSPSQATHHMTLMARDKEGFDNLKYLVSKAFLDGFFFRPRIDDELLKEHSKGLICLSGCLQGRVQQRLLKGRKEEAYETAQFYQKLFGEENYFIEIHEHGISKQKQVLPDLLDIAREFSIPVVLTNDSHYVKREDSEAQDILLCITTGKDRDDEKRLKFEGTEFYIKSAEEMKKLQEDILPQHPEAYSNTMRITEMCNVELPLNRPPLLPKFDVPAGKTDREYLEELCLERMPQRYPKAGRAEKDRLETELDIIDKMGYCAYFLIVWDFVDHARKNGIWVGPGRGSAAGSIVSYLLGITNIDPLKYELFFERFLNPERVSMPDIDIDFDFERRGEVVDYVIEKYGRDNVSKIITFNVLKAKAALKDVARVMKIPFNISNEITKAVPEEVNITLEKALEQSKELRTWSLKNPKLFDLARSLEGIARNSSIHAAGIVIAPEAIWKYAPLASNKGEVYTQYDMKSVESIGLLKMDFLGLKTLTILRNACAHIEKTRGKRLDLDNIPLDDRRTYRMLCEGNTIGVFQFESSGFKSLIQRLKPSVFEDLIAVIALYRPGPLGSGMVDAFIDTKHGKQKAEYPHPLLEGILRETYGVMLYQEQVMQCANVLADYSLGGSDELRRAMGKKIQSEMDAHRERFIAGAAKNGVDRDKAEEIFNLMDKFAGYGFNKSHSAAYALISYQTAYLKANFPAEYMAAVLTNVKNDTDQIALYVEECRRMGIDVLPPDINASYTDFTVTGEGIRFGLGAIKGLGDTVVNSIIEVRERGGPFKDLSSFCRRVDLKLLNRRILETLIKSGAFESFPHNMAQLMAVAEQALRVGAEQKRHQTEGQVTFADLFAASGNAEGFSPGELTYPEIDEFPEAVLLAFEKETLGHYLSGHPLLTHERLLSRMRGLSATYEIEKLEDGRRFLCVGVVKSLRKIQTRSKRELNIVSLEDLHGSCEFPFFGELFAQCKNALKQDATVLVWGAVQIRGDQKRVTPQGAVALEDLFKARDIRAFVSIDLEGAGDLSRDQAARMKNILMTHKGRHPVRVHVPVEDYRVDVELGRKYRVAPNQEFVEDIEELLGQACVRLDIPVPDPRPAGRSSGGTT